MPNFKTHSYSSNPDQAKVQELGFIVDALETLQEDGTERLAVLERIATALETIAAKP